MESGSRHRYLSAPCHRQRRRSPAGTPPTSHPRPRLREGNGRGYGARRGAAWHGRTPCALWGRAGATSFSGGLPNALWATGGTYLLRFLCSPCSHGTEGTPGGPPSPHSSSQGMGASPAHFPPFWGRGRGHAQPPPGAAPPGLGARHQRRAELARPRACSLLGLSFCAAAGGLVSPFFSGNSSPSTEEVALSSFGFPLFATRPPGGRLPPSPPRKCVQWLEAEPRGRTKAQAWGHFQPVGPLCPSLSPQHHNALCHHYSGCYVSLQLYYSKSHTD